MREAFRRLDALGILSRTMHRGAGVRTLSRAEAVDLMIAIEGIDMLTSQLAGEAAQIGTAAANSSHSSARCGPIATGRMTLLAWGGSGSSSTTC